jgi:hypothetical protein
MVKSKPQAWFALNIRSAVKEEYRRKTLISSTYAR